MHYKVSNEFALVDEVVSCFKEIQTQTNFEFVPLSQQNGQDSQLLLYFDLVDDRIREVEEKKVLAQSLLRSSNNNCVWVFVCFKPTEFQEGTKITNSVRDFPTGYASQDGKFIQQYLTFEYMVKSNMRDKSGNFLHLLFDKEQCKRQIIELVEKKNPVSIFSK